MAEATLKERVAALEREVAELRQLVQNGAGIKNGSSTSGMVAGDEIMGRIFEEALKFREKDREKARRRYAKTKRAAP